MAAFLAGFLTIAILAPSGEALAAGQNYTASQITFSMDTQVMGSNGSYSNSNYVQVTNGQDVTIQIVFQLTGPSQGLDVSGTSAQADNISYGGSVNPAASYTAGINSLGAQAWPVASLTDPNSGPQYSASQLASTYPLNSTHFAPGVPRTFTLTIPWSQINSIIQSNTNANTTSSFLVGAAVQLNEQAGFWTSVANYAGASYVVAATGGIGGLLLIGNTVFSSQTAVFLPFKRIYFGTSAIPPPGVPAYGAVSGSLQSPNGGANSLDSLGNLIAKIIDLVIGFIQQLVFDLFSFFIAPLIVSILHIHVYTDTFAAIIYPGWVVVRNLCDIFFILALIAIGMATLFRIESYQYKHLIVQLIIAALLVNFSLVISQAVLGLADTVQNQFLPANVNAITNLAQSLMVNSTTLAGHIENISTGSVVVTVVEPFFNLAMALGTFGVFLAIAGFLVIRIVVLWVLLMVSPVAYVAGVLPATSNLRSQWWQLFLKYAFFTPIMAFFLNIAAVISVTYYTNPVLQKVLNGTNIQTGNDNITLIVFGIGSNVLTNSSAALEAISVVSCSIFSLLPMTPFFTIPGFKIANIPCLTLPPTLTRPFSSGLTFPKSLVETSVFFLLAHP